MNKPFFLALLVFINVTTANDLTVAVAANFSRPMAELVDDFNKLTGKNVIVISGSTGKLAAQITHGAPVDVFLSADTTTINLLVQQGLLDQQPVEVYASGKIALWSNILTEHELNNCLVDSRLQLSCFKILSIANPKLAPYGFAAKEFLAKSYQDLQQQRRLVFAESINQAFQFTLSGNADLGLVAVSQLINNQLVRQKHYIEINSSLYSPIEQSLAVVSRSNNKVLASDFIEYLGSKRGQDIIESFGYRVNR
ncbi:MAG: molybdate ABC transporter substrate-binding protein [Kangiellaceae bacterium]|jgi:molybdate transport system substrate-binding protein|nr:molybdate ABC transporter substrate-binding protein [Kangiellaceae bacterium]